MTQAMNDGSQEYPTRSCRRGRPIAARPRAERVTVRLTREEWAAVRARARGMALARYARNVLLGRGGSFWAEGADAAQSWRTLDQLTDTLVRIEEAMQDRGEAADSVLLDTLVRLGTTLDDVRVRAVEALGCLS